MKSFLFKTSLRPHLRDLPPASTDGSYTQSEATVYNGKTVYLAWKAVVDKTSGAKDSDVTVSDPVNGAVTINVNMQSPVEFKYTLSFTLVNINGAEYKDASGKPYTFSKDFIIPRYITAEEKVNTEKTAFDASFSSTAETLPIKGSTYDEVTISYGSSNSDVYAVAANGDVTITRTLNNEPITLTVTFTCGETSVTHEEQFTVTARERTDAEKAEFEKENYSFDSAATTLPVKGSTYEDVTISYTSSNATVYSVATDGKVNIHKATTNTKITVTVTFTCGGYSDSFTTDEFTVPADNNLKLQKIIEGMTTTITDSITLPEGAVWAVKSGTAITITNGMATVTQPEFADGDAIVVLTATLGESTKDVEITVKAKDQACYAYIINPQLLSAKFYLTGEMVNTYYLKTSTFLTDAVVVYKEALTEGYKFYYLDGSAKKYFAVEKVGTHYNVKYLEEGNVFYHNAESNYWYTTADGDECFLGGSGEYNTGASYAISYVGNTNYYYMQFVETTDETQISDVAIATAESNAITVTTTITGAGSIDLANKAKVYGNEVTYVWTIETDTLSIGTISGNNKLTVTNPASDTTVTLKVVVTYKTATVNKTFTVTVKHKDATSTTTTTYTYTFTKKVFSSNSTKALGDISWTLAGDGDYWGYDGTKGQQLGSSNNPYKNLTLTSTTSFTKVSKIVINTSGGSNVDATFSIKVGNQVVLSSKTISKDASDYLTEIKTPIDGIVQFAYTQKSSKALYIKSITITYAG